MINRIYGCELLMVSYYRAIFGDHRHCGSGGKTILICNLIWHNHVT